MHKIKFGRNVVTQAVTTRIDHSRAEIGKCQTNNKAQTEISFKLEKGLLY